MESNGLSPKQFVTNFWPRCICILRSRAQELTEHKNRLNKLVGRQNAAALEFDPKPSEAAFSTVFFRCSFRPEVVSDVISGTVDQDVGMDVRANFGNSRLKLLGASFSGTTNDLQLSSSSSLLTTLPIC